MKEECAAVYFNTSRNRKIITNERIRISIRIHILTVNVWYIIAEMAKELLQ